MQFQGKKIYFSGIGGIGMSALAKLYLAHGAQVVGSDRVESEITSALAQRGVPIFYLQSGANITEDIDLLIFSAAVPESNPERLRAKDLGIPQKSYFEALAEVTADSELIAVSGTNGKSTSTAMLASIFIDAAKDPSVIVGSQYEKLDANFRDGRSNLFIAEACEYRAHLLLLSPQHILLTNIEEDHLDYFKDLNHIIQTFQQYVNKLKNKDSILVINHDDANIRKLTLPDCKIFSFGLGAGADVTVDKIRKAPGKQTFEVFFRGQPLGEFELSIPGDFNIYNALGAIAMALAFNIPIGIIRKSLSEFRGIWRRFEIIKREPYAVISDYGHHPTAIRETLRGAREFFPGRRLVLIFQPHQKDRTRKLFNEFANAFQACDELILPEIYDVAGRETADDQIKSADFVSVLKKNKPELPVSFAPDLTAAAELAKTEIKPEDVVIVMGAGDVYQIAGAI